MADRAVKGDYIGFTFNGVHSSELGLVRVSNGSRYEVDLLPPLQDKTVQVAGRDGAVYFNSQYNAKPIKVPVAFDNLTEEGFEKLKRLLANKKPTYLWFDETPYKQWLVKSATAQKFKWICFDETRNGKEARIYKGEGTLEFTCFSPYAESRALFLDDKISDVWVWEYQDGRKKRLIKAAEEQIVEKGDPIDIKKTLKDYYNFDEWYKSSRLRNSSENTGLIFNEYHKICDEQDPPIFLNGKVNIYNAGDIPSDLQIIFNEPITKELTISLYSSKNLDKVLKSITIKSFDFLTKDDVTDNGFIIDSKIKMIKGTKDGKPTGHQYNKYKKSGDFFKIPVATDEEYFIIEINEDIPFEVKYKHHYI